MKNWKWEEKKNEYESTKYMYFVAKVENSKKEPKKKEINRKTKENATK